MLTLFIFIFRAITRIVVLSWLIELVNAARKIEDRIPQGAVVAFLIFITVCTSLEALVTLEKNKK